MTNVSKLNSFTVLSTFAIALVLSLGSFVTIAHAADFSTGDLGGGDAGYTDYTLGDAGYTDYTLGNPGYTDYGLSNCGCGSSYTPTFSYTPSFSTPTSVGHTAYFPATPITFNSPSYIPPASRINTPVVSQPSVTNVNNNTNNNVNNITNNNNSSAIAIATVTPVAAAPVQYQVQYVQPPVYQQTYQRPYCTITISNYNGNSYGQYGSNQLATLTWSSSGATSGYISPNVGNVSGYGSMQVYPSNSQIYTMTVYGQGGSATCTTQPYYVAPVTPYVSLSQIPYTGFDFGTLGNSIYWLSLMVFAGAAAYLVLYFNGGALAILGMKGKSASQVVMPKITVTHAPAFVAAAIKDEPVVSPIQLVSNRNNTLDTMHITHSKAGAAPRIHISRE